ncbi:MAG: cytochrome c biogenesis protein ResB [Limisphaerales bacterium]
MSRLIKFLSSLKLTVVLLAFGLVLIFIGTVAQVHEGLYTAQTRFFKSWFVIGVTVFNTKMPWLVLPGGYTVGSALFASLVTAHFTRFTWTWRKSGIFLTHLGIILLLLGQFGTDILSTESGMRLEEGETKNYSEDFHAYELVFINKSLASEDEVVAIPEMLLAAKGGITHPQLPFTVKVKEYWPNTDLTNYGPFIAESLAKEGFVKPAADQGIGPKVMVLSLPVVTAMDSRNIPSAVLEVTAGGAVKGSWLVSGQTTAQQSVEHDGKTWELALRSRRYYKPYSMTLLEFKHERYPGTEIPKDFRSRIRLVNPGKNEDRELEIFMNNPLRYAGLTFYQAGFEPGDKATVLQVVKNPNWLTPYFACVLVGVGLTVQFMIHLVGFIQKRMAPATARVSGAKANQPRKTAENTKK